ncbi:hypothetical protein B5S31_g2539 [[Candida] boidinii]|nr:hypothetical protein B5S31_g2539 [[Candida] boidinii]
MARPRLILLLRHGESEGNKDKCVNQYIPNHKVPLTKKGHTQARLAGLELKKLVDFEKDSILFYTSPYLRARQTLDGVLKGLASEEDDEDDEILKEQTKDNKDCCEDEEGEGEGENKNDEVHDGQHHYEREEDRACLLAKNIIMNNKVEKNLKIRHQIYEEPRMREQDFGNFQSTSEEMQKIWKERAHYGHFFYRIPHGESAADVYDRCAGFNETLFRQFNTDKFPSILVLVTHGIWARVFLMKWFRWTVEEFEDLTNIPHCQFIIMEKNEETERYKLTTPLTKWSKLDEDSDGNMKTKLCKETTAQFKFNSNAIVNDKEVSEVVEAELEQKRKMLEIKKIYEKSMQNFKIEQELLEREHEHDHDHDHEG